MAKRNNKEIVELSEKEHVRLKSTMYVSTISPTEDDMLLIQSDNKLKKEKIVYSVGFYKCFIEILDNALDEAKRLKGKMSKVEVHFNSLTSEVKIKDFGEGFYKGQEINKETGLNKIETAVSRLRAGSNFFNEDIEESLIGTNGVGSSIVNILSERFTIESVNSDGWFFREWLDFEKTELQLDKKERRKDLGTTVTFVPFKGVFKHDQKWDKKIIHTFMTFKQWLVKNTEKEISNLVFECYFDDEKLDLNVDFLPKDRVEIKTKIGQVVIFETYDDSSSTSFINSAQCSGIHEKIINDHINDHLKYHMGHHYYDCFTALNFLPKLVKFGDQNKTRFVTTRFDIMEIMNKEVLSKIDRHFIGSDLYKKIESKIEEVNRAQTIKNIKSAKKNSKVKFSEKYTPPSGKNEIIFLTEGNSAAGGILQKRNPQVEGVYALKGKVKNCQTLSDLSTNGEIIDLMNILDLEVDSAKGPSFEKIVIATDPDCLHHSTKVLTKNGSKLISEITYGDLVLTHSNKYKAIRRITEKMSKDYIELYFGTSVFKCTLEHKWPVYIRSSNKTINKEAQDLLITDEILFNSLLDDVNAEPNFICPSSIQHIISESDELFIDIEVQDDHTFYVTDDINCYLTHNCDGYHISSLLINTFSKWFPHLVEKGHLYILAVPIVSLDVGKTRKYFYKYEDYQNWISINSTYTNLRYLKGLGSLDSERDWEYVLKTNRVLFQVYKDRSANKMLDIAFNGNAFGRKQWLKDEIK